MTICGKDIHYNHERHFPTSDICCQSRKTTRGTNRLHAKLPSIASSAKG